MTPPRNIVRVDHEGSHTHAWRVTLQRGNKGVGSLFSADSGAIKIPASCSFLDAG